MNYLDEKFGKCDHWLPTNGEDVLCPNLIARLDHLNSLRLDGIHAITGKTGCTLTCRRVEHDHFLVTSNDVHMMFASESNTVRNRISLR